MRLTIFTERDAAAVPTGVVVDSAHGPILIDEKREKADGSVVTISLLGQRINGKGERRVNLTFQPREQVRILPTADEVEAIWSQLLTGVDRGSKHWLEQHDTGDSIPMAPWDANHRTGRLRVSALGSWYEIATLVEDTDPGRRLPEPDADDTPADA